MRRTLALAQERLERATGVMVDHRRRSRMEDNAHLLIAWRPWGSLSWAELAGVRVGFQGRLGSHVVTAIWIDMPAATDLSGGYHPRPVVERLTGRFRPFRPERAVGDPEQEHAA